MAEIGYQEINLMKLELRLILKRIKIEINRIQREIQITKRTIVKLKSLNREDTSKLAFFELIKQQKYLEGIQNSYEKYFKIYEDLISNRLSNEEIKDLKKELFLIEKEEERYKQKEEKKRKKGAKEAYAAPPPSYKLWYKQEPIPVDIKASLEKILAKELPLQEVEIPKTGEEALLLDEKWEDFISQEEKIIEDKTEDIQKELEKIKSELSAQQPVLGPVPGAGYGSGLPQPSAPTTTTPKKPSIARPEEEVLIEAPSEEPEPIEGVEKEVEEEDEEKPREKVEKKSIKRYADINADKKMEIEKEHKLTIQLKREETTVTGTIVMLNIPLKREEEPPDIDIFVMAPGFEIPEFRKTLTVPLNRDSDLIEFILIPQELGKHYVFVEFYQESKLLGRAIIDVEVKRKVKETKTIQKSFNFTMVREVDIDVTLRIIRYANEFIFSLFTKHGGTILDPKATFGTIKIDDDYINSLNELIREVAFDFDHPEQSLDKIIKLGEKVYQIIPEPMREAINKIDPKYLIFETGDLFVPFELAYDGENFLCLKYCIGKRILDENKDFTAPPICFGDQDFDFILVESNPKHDLELKERELISELIKKYRVNFTPLMGKNASKKILNKLFIRPLEILHFAGHGMFNEKNPDKSGLLMEDGILTADDIKNIKVNGYPLIFINACEAATIKKVNKFKGVGGIARAFLGSGAIGFIGPLWEITDDLAAEFADEFYKKVFTENLSVGEAIKAVKTELKEKYPHILWATFNYYGDPTLHLCPQINI